MADDFKLGDKNGAIITFAQLCQNILGVAQLETLNQVFAVPLNYRAKWKTVRRSMPNLNSASLTSDYYKGDGGRCGINIPQLVRYSDIRTAKWSHLPPRSGMGLVEPLIVSHLYWHGRYNRFARPFISTSTVTSFTYNKTGSGSRGFIAPVLSISDDGSSTELRLSDIPFLQSLYVAVSLVPSGSDPTEYSTQTTSSPLTSNDIMGVEFAADALNRLPDGNYDMWYYLTTAHKSYGGASRVAENYAIDWGNGYANPLQLKIMQLSPFYVNVLRYSNSSPAALQSFPADVNTAIGCYNTMWFECRFTNRTGGAIIINRQSLDLSVDGFWFPPSSSQKPTLSTGTDIINIPANGQAIYIMTGHFSRVGNTDKVPPSPQDDYNEWANYTIFYEGANVGSTGVFRIRTNG